MSTPTTADGPTVGLRVTEADKAARKAWIDQNPLRQWRRSQTPRLPVLDAAGIVGVGSSMLAMYEKGIHTPTGPRAAKFDEILGDGWRERWDAWLAAKPPATGNPPIPA